MRIESVNVVAFFRQNLALETSASLSATAVAEPIGNPTSDFAGIMPCSTAGLTLVIALGVASANALHIYSGTRSGICDVMFEAASTLPACSATGCLRCRAPSGNGNAVPCAGRSENVP
jgi:hypothetical protein